MLFDKILYINLLKRPDRNEHIVKTLEYLDLFNMCERIDAVDGRKLEKEKISNNLISSEGVEDAYNKDQRLYEPLTQGGIGCALSHKKVYEKIISDNINKCLILEDDAKFDIDFFKKMDEIDVPEDFDMLFLGYHVSHVKKNVNKYCFVPEKVYGLFGYVVSLEGARKLLDIFPLTYQIDTEISNNMDKFNAYCIKSDNHLIYSDRSSVTTQFGTDIQTREGFGSTLMTNLSLYFVKHKLSRYLNYRLSGW